MSELAICRRYAAALQAEADSLGIVDRVDEDVAMTRESLATSRELQLLFASPVIGTAKKRSIIEQLFSDRTSDVFVRFLLLLNEKGRGSLISDVLSEYRRVRNEQLGIVEAETRTAMPLSDDVVESLTERLSRRFGATVHLDLKEDPSLLGGVVVRVGDSVYDGSLKRQLSVLKTQLQSDGSFRK
jgi:F-type H+-transporting ATPase subunit delta